MANKTITDFYSAGPLTGNEKLEVVQNGNSRSATTQEVADLAGGISAENNLSDLDDIDEARDNLDVYSKQQVDQIVDEAMGNMTPIPMTNGFFRAEPPAASEILLDWAFTDAARLPANALGSAIQVGGNPDADFVIDVQRNDVSVGTITIATDGAVTAVVTETDYDVIDYMTLVAPVTPDVGISRLRVTMRLLRVTE